LEGLRYIREKVGYSQQELADASGVSQGAISDIEIGRRKPRGQTLRKLAAALGVEVADLYQGEPDRGKVGASRIGRFSETEFALAEAYLEQRRNASRQLAEWASFADAVARDWETEGRDISPHEIRTLLASLEGRIASGILEVRHHRRSELVDAIVDTRVQDASDEFELERLHKAVGRLRDVADPVLRIERADRERERFVVIEGALASEVLEKTA
jgi:transcriptional regulator with XRE-family HTH domain